MDKIFSGKTLQEAKEQAYEFFASHGISEEKIETQILEQPIKKIFGGYKGEYKINAIVSDELMLTEKEPDKSAVKEKEQAQASSPQAEKADDISYDDSSKVIIRYLTGVLTELGAKDFKINVLAKEDITVFDIVGDKMGIAIGRRGETLDALQYLAILANNRSGQPYSRISVDCNGYREKRSETLEVLAVRTAKKVLAQGRRITLEPMNPYERRIIHSKVSEMEGVYSNSVGEEPFRKVVISANIPKSRRNDSTRSGGYSNRDNRQRPSVGKSYKQSTGFQTSFERDYKREKKESVEISQDTVDFEKNSSLFGKIEL